MTINDRTAKSFNVAEPDDTAAAILTVNSERNDKVSLRQYPYPYQAMLAIASDLDDTPDTDTYFDISRFLNTFEETAIGPGVGLEIGNTVYFDMPKGHVLYWKSSEADRKRFRELIKSGHIDCFHSFGDLASTRKQIVQSLKELESHGCALRVWIDHATAPSNFGADIMRGSGDVVSAPAYHADLTIAHGVKYVWMGRVTSVVGQNVPKSYRGIFNLHQPIASLRSLGKEIVKSILSRDKKSRYLMHRSNEVLQKTTLRSGHPVMEFIRCDPHPEGISVGDRGDRFFESVSESVLNRLVKNQGISIIYTHLGKAGKCKSIFPPETVAAFNGISARFRNGEILVATTARVLDYVRSLESIQWEWNVDQGFLNIDVTAPDDVPNGLSFDYQSELPVRLRVNGLVHDDIILSERNSDRLSTVSLPWSTLTYPSI